jgi:hypothetical protein
LPGIAVPVGEVVEAEGDDPSRGGGVSTKRSNRTPRSKDKAPFTPTGARRFACLGSCGFGE